MSADLPAVLAIDGGNTKTDLALVGADGRLVTTVTGPGIPRTADPLSCVAVLDGIVRTAGARLGITAAPFARHTSACLANIDLPEEAQLVAGALRRCGWSATTDVVNDTFAVLRTGLERGGPTGPAGDPIWGVAVVCGTGVNCVGVDRTGRTHRYLALGDLSGDWGGGAFLGRAALWCAVRSEDGRGPSTSLQQRVPAHFGVASLDAVVRGIHSTRLPADLSTLVPLLLAAAADGDRVAGRIVRRQAREIARMVAVALRALDLLGEPVPVVLGGGVLTAGDPLLADRTRTALAVVAPLARVRVSAVAPVVGAALLGLDRAGADRAAERTLRTAFTTITTIPR